MTKHKRRPQAVLWLWAAGAAVVFALGFAGHRVMRSWADRIFVGTKNAGYYHYDIVEFKVTANDRALVRQWQEQPPAAVVRRNGYDVVTIGRLSAVRLRWDETLQAFTGRWPVPWNAPDGEYTVALQALPELEDRVRATPFRIKRRVPKKIPPGFVAINLETANPIRTMRVRGPDGVMKDWKGLLDWVQYLKGDAFWVLGGITPGTKPGQVWMTDNLPILQEIGKECHKRKIKFGVWAMCYLTAKRPPVKGYEYAVDFEDGKLVPTRSISIRDPKRVADLVKFYGDLAKLPEVDYLGLDYIRNALGGYELDDDYFREMPGAYIPEGWEKLSPEARRLMFVRHKIKRKDKDFIDRWQWWRAHRVANIVKQVREAVGPDKMLWAFTLGWEYGWQHGQDPVMMNDAGLDVDAIMLYEADRPQFDFMVDDWRKYVKKGDVQLIGSNVVDWPLHQFTVDPSGPEEFTRRMKKAIDGLYGDGRLEGIFIHDLSRLLWGRKGPYSTDDWAKAIRDSVEYLRRGEKKSKRPS